MALPATRIRSWRNASSPPDGGPRVPVPQRPTHRRLTSFWWPGHGAALSVKGVAVVVALIVELEVCGEGLHQRSGPSEVPGAAAPRPARPGRWAPAPRPQSSTCATIASSRTRRHRQPLVHVTHDRPTALGTVRSRGALVRSGSRRPLLISGPGNGLARVSASWPEQVGNWETNGKSIMQNSATYCTKTQRTTRTRMLRRRSCDGHSSDLLHPSSAGSSAASRHSVRPPPPRSPTRTSGPRPCSTSARSPDSAPRPPTTARCSTRPWRPWPPRPRNFSTASRSAAPPPAGTHTPERRSCPRHWLAITNRAAPAPVGDRSETARARSTY